MKIGSQMSNLWYLDELVPILDTFWTPFFFFIKTQNWEKAAHSRPSSVQLFLILKIYLEGKIWRYGGF